MSRAAAGLLKFAGDAVRAVTVQLATVPTALKGIRQESNDHGAKQVSLADLIVLAGSAAVERGPRTAATTSRSPSPRPHRRVAGLDRRRLV
jgi:catalase (peroxidase I)